MPSGQQVHVSLPSVPSGPDHFRASNHPCFKLASPEALQELQRRIYEHKEKSSSAAAVYAVDKPGEGNSGAQGEEYPSRFFARDAAGNR